MKTATAGRVSFLDGQNELPMLVVETAWSTAEIYLLGAHVTRFTKKNEQPLLFLSQCAKFQEGQPIRGGIPVILPWFGMREGMPMHGFARLKTWDVKEVIPGADGSMSIRFRLPECPESSAFPPFTADYVVTINETLTAQLIITNKSDSEVLPVENCLHTYFEVGDITQVSVTGLKGATYLDKVANFARKHENSDAIHFSSEVDRIYTNSAGTCEILDPAFKRKIIVEKQNSNSTVVWNPWVAKAQQMPDFGNDEYKTMVCVESGNVAVNALKLRPGESTTLTVKLSSAPLA